MSMGQRRHDDEPDSVEVTLVLTRSQIRSLAEQLARAAARDQERTRLYLRVESTETSHASEQAEVEASRERQSLDTRRLIDDLARLGAKVPPEEWEQLPPDLTDQLDHYLYGTPRR